ncbi:TIGR04076 family protein [Gemmatimonadota bacterium]
MYELKVSVKKVMGECTATPPMKPGDHFTVRDGRIEIPEGGYICLWALQSLMPVLTPKERKISEEKEDDWMWRVHHTQCPDPEGRVIFKIEQTGVLDKDAVTEAEEKQERMGEVAEEADGEGDAGGEGTVQVAGTSETGSAHPASQEDGLKSLRVVVESVNGKCTAPMHPGDEFTLRSGRLYIPPGGHFCLYALQAAIPLLPAKQRVLQDGDWLKEDYKVLCPDPAGNVILRIETVE